MKNVRNNITDLLISAQGILCTSIKHTDTVTKVR